MLSHSFLIFGPGTVLYLFLSPMITAQIQAQLYLDARHRFPITLTINPSETKPYHYVRIRVKGVSKGVSMVRPAVHLSQSITSLNILNT